MIPSLSSWCLAGFLFDSWWFGFYLDRWLQPMPLVFLRDLPISWLLRFSRILYSCPWYPRARYFHFSIIYHGFYDYSMSPPGLIGTFLAGASFAGDTFMIASNRVARKCPSPRHWEELSKFSQSMTPDEFLSHWDISLKEMAEIIGVSVSTVRHWFCRDSRSHPQSHHMLKLALVHRRWSRL